MPTKWYIQLNKIAMSLIFFIPLCVIAVFESQIHTGHKNRLEEYFNGPADEEDGNPKIEDPDCDDDDGGVICRMSFEELTKVFPKSVASYLNLLGHDR